MRWTLVHLIAGAAITAACWYMEPPHNRAVAIMYCLPPAVILLAAITINPFSPGKKMGKET